MITVKAGTNLIILDACLVFCVSLIFTYFSFYHPVSQINILPVYIMSTHADLFNSPSGNVRKDSSSFVTEKILVKFLIKKY